MVLVRPLPSCARMPLHPLLNAFSPSSSTHRSLPATITSVPSSSRYFSSSNQSSSSTTSSFSSSSSSSSPPSNDRHRVQRRLAAICGASLAAVSYAAVQAAPSSSDSIPKSIDNNHISANNNTIGERIPALGHFLMSDITRAFDNQSMNRSIERGKIKEYSVAYHTANGTIEDSFAIKEKVHSKEGGALFSVFDGHSGSGASWFCRDELLGYLEHYALSGRSLSLLSPSAFVDADNDFMTYAWMDGRYHDGLSGACALVTHITNDKLITAHAGDCKAVLGRRARNASPFSVFRSSSSIPSFQAIELTADHQIDTNVSERNRLLREHPGEDDVIKRNRVKGRLQPTRGLGDAVYKRMEYYNYKYGFGRSGQIWTPPYTTSEPDIKEIKLNENDEFIVLASDGLYLDLSPQAVVDCVAEYLYADKDKESKDGLPRLQTASAHLVRRALLAAASQRVDKRFTLHDSLSWIMSVPTGMRRYIHDDLTVIVILLDHTSNYPSDESLQSPSLPIPPHLHRAVMDPNHPLWSNPSPSMIEWKSNYLSSLNNKSIQWPFQSIPIQYNPYTNITAQQSLNYFSSLHLYKGLPPSSATGASVTPSATSTKKSPPQKKSAL